jgi:hypothetical protein
MLKRIVALGLLAMVGMAAPAAAQQYPPDENVVKTSAAALCPGDPLTVEAQIFTPGSTVVVRLVGDDDLDFGTTTADANGVASFSGTIPQDQAPGDYTARVTGTGADGQELVLNASIEILECPVEAQAVPAGELPRTGSGGIMTPLKIGLGLAALGGLLLALAANRRRRAMRGTHLKPA